MGLMSRVWEKRSSLSNPDSWLTNWFGGGRGSATGINVTEMKALQSTAVFACVKILSETLASLPLHVYQRLPEGGKARAPNHYLYTILHDISNDEMTSFTLRETLMGHLALWGNAYAEIDWNESGEINGLWPLRPDKTKPRRDTVTKQMMYDVHLPDGQMVTLPAYRVLHIHGFSIDGLVGLNPIDYARESVALSLATQEYGAAFFGNGATPSGVLEHLGVLGETGRENLRDSMTEMHQGLNKAHRLMILEEGMTYKQIGIPPDTAQYLETRKFQVTDIARFYRIPPHMIADLERSTNNNIEHQGIEFVVHTIRPWLVRWEQTMLHKLFLPSERKKGFYIEFNVDGLLRGDYKSRQEGLRIARDSGIITRNEWRAMENMNPLTEDQINDTWRPVNMVPGDTPVDMAAAHAEAAKEVKKG